MGVSSTTRNDDQLAIESVVVNRGRVERTLESYKQGPCSDVAPVLLRDRPRYYHSAAEETLSSGETV